LLRFVLPLAAFASYHACVFRTHILLPTTLVLCGFLGISSHVVAEETTPVERVVINRIMAVVDQDVITLVEVQRRVEPFQKRLASVAPDKREAAEVQLRRDIIQEAIDDRLIAREARALRVSIASTEIDAALDGISKAKDVTRERLMQLVSEHGFTEAQYREQLVRQLLIGKLLRIRMAEQLKNVDKDADKASKQIEKIEKAYLLGLRGNIFIEVRL
jgi:maltodextrin utilization protein YvdJ